MSHALSIFGATRIINLASRHDRRAEMRAQLRRIGVPDDAPDVAFFDAVRPREAGGFPTLGTRGCFLSHLGVLEQTLSRGDDSVLILEDDLNFSADFHRHISAVSAALARSQWSIFYGGYTIEGNAAPAHGGAIGAIDPALAVTCAHFVAFRGAALHQLPAYLRAIIGRAPGHPEGGPMHVDGAYSRFRQEHPELETVVALPALGYQRASRSDIRAVRWYDDWPVVREGVDWIRRRKNAA
jgi:glycosyl transferase, family 25